MGPESDNHSPQKIQTRNRHRQTEGEATGGWRRRSAGRVHTPVKICPRAPGPAERLESGSCSGSRANPLGGQFGCRILAFTTVRGPPSVVSGCQRVAICYNVPRKGIRHLTLGHCQHPHWLLSRNCPRLHL